MNPEEPKEELTNEEAPIEQLPELPPPDTKALFRDLLPMLLGVPVLTLVMFAVYALIGKWRWQVLTGGLLGCAVVLGYFLMLTFSLLRAEQAETVTKGRFTAQGGVILRMLVLLGVLVFALKSGWFEPLATLLPLIFLRPAIFLSELFRKKTVRKD